MFEKLLSLATVGSSIASVGLLHRFLLRMTNILILAVISAFTVCALIASLFYLMYVALVHYGCGPTEAVIVVGCVQLIIALIFVGVTLKMLKSLSNPSASPHPSGKTIVSDVSTIIEAFLDGFVNPKKRD